MARPERDAIGVHRAMCSPMSAPPASPFAPTPRSRRSPLARRLLRRCGARCGDGCAVRALRAPGRSRVRHRQPCRRPHRQLPPASVRAWWRWSRSRCARGRSGPSMRAIDDVTLIEAACGAQARQADAAHQLRQSDGLDGLGRFHLGGRRRRRLGGAGVGHRDRGARAQLSMRWSPSMARRPSPRSTWRASRTRCSPACPGLCRSCPSSSPRSSATWR